MVWGIGQLASGPLLTLTIIVINSDTQSSLFTGSGGRESREISLFIGEGPFHKVQSFIIWADGLGWDAAWGGCRGSGAPQLKTRGDLATGGSRGGGKFQRGEETSRAREAAVRQP